MPINRAQSYFITNNRKPKDWPVEFNKKPFEIPQKSKKIIKIQTQIPEKNEPGDYIFRFDVESDRDPNISDSVSTTITLLPELSVEKLRVEPKTVYANHGAELQLNVKNLGQAVARNIVINFYNGTEFKPQFVINSDIIPELYGNENVTLNFTWAVGGAGNYNISVFIDPNSDIQEVANRIGNNFKTKKITVSVKPPDKPPDNGSNGGTDDSMGYLIPVIGAIVASVIVLILIYFIVTRVRSTEKKEQTAHKIPLTRSGGERKGKAGKKKARKEKL